jgi:hypothetical protein
MQDVQIHALNRHEKCRHNARVIRVVPQLDLRESEVPDRCDVDPPRALIGNGVSDRQEMA